MYIFPIKGTYRLTQKFGQNLLNYAQFGLKAHNGLDYACVTGTPIIAPQDGYVVDTFNTAKPDAGGYGNEVRMLIATEEPNIYHDWIFGHLLTVFVTKGQFVKQGTPLGLSDNTGFSSGPHLHFGVRRLKRTGTGTGTFKNYLDEAYLIEEYNNGYFGYFDPEPLFNAPVDLLPVDLRYNQVINKPFEIWWKWRHEKYAIKRLLNAKMKYTNREFNGLVYGRWDIETILDPAQYPLWTEKTKLEFKKLFNK